MHRRAADALLAAIAASVLVLVVLVAPAPPAAAAATVERIYGADRFATAAAISRTAFPASDISVAFVANGLDYADSLAIGPVAAKLGGPVLLAAADRLPAATRDELLRLRPQKIVVVGGTGVVGSAVEDQLRNLAPAFERIAGVDRYETARLIAAYGFPDGAPSVVIATGRDFPDALSGAALAASRGAPLLLVDGAASQADEPTVAGLVALSPAEALVLGGRAIVSDGVAATVAAASGATWRRIAGADRYATSGLVAQEFGSISRVYLATGLTFADATAVVPLSHRDHAPVVLSPALCSPTSIRSVITKSTVTSRVMLGGPMVLRGLAGAAHECLSLTAASSIWVLVNKRHPLSPLRYAPGDLRTPAVRNAGGGMLRAEAATALERLAAASQSSGAGALGNASAYRSYDTQYAVHQGHIRRLGEARALQASARPGYSEHQTGLAVDVVACGSGCGSLDGFASTAQGRWVAANAHRYGFIVRYRPGATSVTGYLSEPWHLRYVGVALATDYFANGFTSLEQYYGAAAAPTY